MFSLLPCKGNLQSALLSTSSTTILKQSNLNVLKTCNRTELYFQKTRIKKKIAASWAANAISSGQVQCNLTNSYSLVSAAVNRT